MNVKLSHVHLALAHEEGMIRVHVELVKKQNNVFTESITVSPNQILKPRVMHLC